MTSKGKSRRRGGRQGRGTSYKYLGIVATRSGSERFKHKNLAKWGGWNLTELAVDKLAKTCQEVALATDYKRDEVGDIGNASFFVRPHTLNGGDVPYQYVVKWLYTMYYEKNTDFDALMCLFTTNPMITIDNIREAQKRFEDNKMDILRSYDDNGVENGLYIMKTKVLAERWLYDVYTGSINLPGHEIHTKAELKRIYKNALFNS